MVSASPTVYFQCESQNPTDYMSQHHMKSICEWGQKIAEEYVSYMCEQACPKAVPLNELKKATAEDPLLQKVYSQRRVVQVQGM